MSDEQWEDAAIKRLQEIADQGGYSRGFSAGWSARGHADALLAKKVEPSDKVPELSIVNGYLVEFVDQCTCGSDLSMGYGHEPGCGYEPLTKLSDLPGWPVPAGPHGEVTS